MDVLQHPIGPRFIYLAGHSRHASGTNEYFRVPLILGKLNIDDYAMM